MTQPNKQPLDNRELLAEAVRISRSAGKLLRDRLSTGFSIQHKGVVDLVTEVDQEAQSLIEKGIRQKYPDHGILAEEDLEIQGSTGYLWIVDPLDGTTNYAHRFPVFSVSIAVLHENNPLCGVVFNPVMDELFSAVRGEGASLNDSPINVSGTLELDDSLLGTGFPYNLRETSDNNLDHFRNFALKAQDIRRCGSAALDLCYVACGRMDGFWELGLKPWDVAAGALIVREAGGITTDFIGAELGLDVSRVLASNGKIHQQMMEVLKS